MLNDIKKQGHKIRIKRFAPGLKSCEVWIVIHPKDIVRYDSKTYKNVMNINKFGWVKISADKLKEKLQDNGKNGLKSYQQVKVIICDEIIQNKEKTDRVIDYKFILVKS